MKNLIPFIVLFAAFVSACDDEKAPQGQFPDDQFIQVIEEVEPQFDPAPLPPCADGEAMASDGICYKVLPTCADDEIVDQNGTCMKCDGTIENGVCVKIEEATEVNKFLVKDICLTNPSSAKCLPIGSGVLYGVEIDSSNKLFIDNGLSPADQVENKDVTIDPTNYMDFDLY